MVTATTLPSSTVVLRFPLREAFENEEEESYQLLELPPEILRRVEASNEIFPWVEYWSGPLIEQTC